MRTIMILIWILCLTKFVTAQTIEKSSIDSGGASVSAGGIEILYTIGEVVVQEQSTPNVSISEGFINASFKIKIEPIVFLQGPLLNPSSPNLMNDALRSTNLIPTTSPYSDNATCNASVFNTTGDNAMVDWVWVELRAANDNTKIINARSALLQRDGDIVNLDGISNLTMQAAPTNYYVVVNHRNHLGVMSSNLIGLSEDSVTTIDFRSNGFSTFGNNAQVQLASNDMALWAGDINSDEKIQFSGSGNDVNALKDFVLANAPIPLLTVPVNGYHNHDIDLNGEAKFSGSNNDSNSIKDIILGHPINQILGLITFTISAQLPN